MAGRVGWISGRWFFVSGQGCSGQFSEVAGNDSLGIAVFTLKASLRSAGVVTDGLCSLSQAYHCS